MKLAIAPKYNTTGKKDATGAFQPEARAFCRLHNVPPPFLFDHHAPEGLPRYQQTHDFLTAQPRGTVEAVAIFSHGYKSGLQIGVSINGPTMRQFAVALAIACVRAPVIALYSCDCARDNDDDREDDKLPGPGGDGGFADKLRDELGKVSCHATIYAHSTTGHTTWNPWVRRFDPGEMAGGHWVVEPHSELWGRWVRALRETSLRHRFPFLAGFELTRELVGLDV